TARRRTRSIHAAGICQALDKSARPACPRRENLPAALRQNAEGSEMSGSEDARSMVLTRIRGALGITKLDRARRAAVIRRLERHPRSTIPAQALLSSAGCVSQLAEMLTKQAAEVARVATPEDAVHAIASYLSSNNLPPRLRIGADLSLAGLPWKAAWDISRVYGRAEPSDKACLSRHRRRGRDRHFVSRFRCRQPHHSQFPARVSHGPRQSFGYRRLIRGGLGSLAQDLRRTNA